MRELKYQQPYFYTGLYEDELKAEYLAEIKEQNSWIGKVIKSKGDYVVRYSRIYHGYALLEEVWDGCSDNFIIEIREENYVLELLDVVNKHGKSMWETIHQLEKLYSGSKGFMNFYGSEHRIRVAGFVADLKERLNEYKNI